jgi:hypothetical protein
LDLFEFATPGSNQLGIDPADATTWSNEHKLSARFLRELLTEESIDGVALPASLWLTRIWCSENIDLSGCAIKREVIFELCRFEKEFAARAAKFESNLWFSRCSMGSILMDDCAIDGTLKIEGTVDGDLWAMNSKFGRSLTLYGTVAGEVSLQHSEIDQGLDAHGLIANEANLEGISVKSALNLSNAKLTIGLWAADIIAQSSFYLGGVETEGTIEFSRARVAGSIDLANVKAGRIIGENASIAGGVFASKAQAGSISLISTEIRDDLRLEGQR